WLYEPVLRLVIRRPRPVIVGGCLLFAVGAVIFMNFGQEFIPALDEKNVAVNVVRIPGTSLNQSQAMQFNVEKAISRFPEVAFVFSKTGTAEVASDPMPPNTSDAFIILKPEREWPDPGLSKSVLLDRLEHALNQLPGSSYEFTQPIQMRFNELLA